MIRKIGLEADAGLYNSVLLLQGFATRSLQFKVFLASIILLFTAGARILFYYCQKSSHSVSCACDGFIMVEQYVEDGQYDKSQCQGTYKPAEDNRYKGLLDFGT